MCGRMIERFEQEKSGYYMEQHRQRGELAYYDYRGDLIHAPFVNLALGGVNNARRFVATYSAMAEWGAQVLQKARAMGKSNYVLEE
jgi:hypothetical protein